MSPVPTSDNSTNRFEKIKKISSHGTEYWSTRDLMAELGYDEWRNFEQTVIKRAKDACVQSGATIDNHFVETNKMIDTARNAKRQVKDYFVSRLAGYLIAMNGDPSKPAVADAQIYFAVQTRRQELYEENLAIEQRIEARQMTAEAFRQLNGVAKDAGVTRFGLFHNDGYEGLYNMSLGNLKRKKGIGEKENPLDRMGLTELTANAFRAALAKEVIKVQNVKSEDKARRVNFEQGRKVRNIIVESGITAPENLPVEPDIKKVVSQNKRLVAKRAKQITESETLE